MKTIKIRITNPNGLYSSLATRLLQGLKAYYSEVEATYNSKTINMKSIMGVLSLGVPEKAILEVTAKGQDEVDTINYIVSEVKKLEIGEEIN